MEYFKWQHYVVKGVKYSTRHLCWEYLAATLAKVYVDHQAMTENDKTRPNYEMLVVP